MPEAVIVSIARSPIGRAMKGSLGMRPDDLAAQMVQAALDKVPALDPTDINDLILGCGLPGGEQGFNMGRNVAVQLGYDFIPGTTITRYCSSSLQTTRMALHAIKAGEGDVFISAGVETVSRFAAGTSDSLPDTQNPLYADAQTRTEKLAPGGQQWVDPREEGLVPDTYIAMGQTAENVAQITGITREEQDRWAVRSQNRAEEAIGGGFFAREITPVTLPDGTVCPPTTAPAPAPPGGGQPAQAGVPPGRHRHRRQRVPAQRRRRRPGGHVRHQGQGAGADAAGPDRVHRGVRAVAGDHGTGPDRGVRRPSPSPGWGSPTSTWSRSTRRSPCR